MQADPTQALTRFIRDIPDFPKPGILFKDITPLLKDPTAFDRALDGLVAPFGPAAFDTIVGIESRGFIFGAALAGKLGKSFVPARKPGKLPAKVDTVEYALEYGTDRLQMHSDALGKGERVLIVDDVIATGGTAAASAELVRRQGAVPVGAAFVIELAFLGGRAKMGDLRIESVIRYE